MEVEDIFGYVRPVVTELLVKDYEFYKATYCGVCRAMKKHTGALSGITLSYDSVLLALVRMLYLPDSEIGARKRRCVAHPIKSRPMLDINAATEYTARVFAILTYYKIKDDLGDEALGKRLLLLPVRPIVRRGHRLSRLPDVSQIIKDRLDRISELEREKTASVDMGASLFGELLGEVFAYSLSPRERIVAYEFGYYLGRFIYSADAAEDYEEDRLSGKYNPYVLLYEGKSLTRENKESIRCALVFECTRIEASLNLMEFGNRKTIENIVKNIIYRGLIKRIDFLDSDADNDKKGEGGRI